MAPAINTLCVSMEENKQTATFLQLFELVVSVPMSEFGHDGYLIYIW
jgi:hypothetical protein